MTLLGGFLVYQCRRWSKSISKKQPSGVKLYFFNPASQMELNLCKLAFIYVVFKGLEGSTAENQLDSAAC